MGHLYIDIKVRGKKAQKELKNVSIDTGATYTVLPEDILKEIDAWGPILDNIEVELGSGEKVKAKAYGIVITFRNAKSVVGVEILESMGLKLDPTQGKLEFTRPKGIAYFYEKFITF